MCLLDIEPAHHAQAKADRRLRWNGEAPWVRRRALIMRPIGVTTDSNGMHMIWG